MNRYFLLPAVFFFLLCPLVSSGVLAQAKISFNETLFDFGKVKEEGGPVEHEFAFTNTGTDSLVLSEVKASCGCTTPQWSQEPIAPGEQGIVKAVYNPRNRPGVFNKSISVTTNDEKSIHLLYIKGFVTPRPSTPEDDFPSVMGNLRVKYRTMNMGKITTKEPVTRSFEVYNSSNAIIRFNNEVNAPSHISIAFDPPELLPLQKGNINLTYDAEAKHDLGFVTDRIALYTNEEDSAKEFSVMATIEEYFAPLTKEDLQKAPRIVLDRTTHDFGTLNEGDVEKTSFIFTNTGRSELKIRKTKANCGCTVSQPEKTSLAPGESSKITVTFNTADRKGRQQKLVTIFSNDPTNPTQQLSITAQVRSDGAE